MPFRPSTLFIASSLFFGVRTVGAAESPADQNWAQWRGPLANGVAPAGDPPVAWDETKNVKWKVKVPGRGTSTPIVWDGQVFIQTAIPAAKKTEPPAAEKVEKKETEKDSAKTEPAKEEEKAKDESKGRRGGRGGRGGRPSDPQQFVLLCLDRATGKTLWQQVACEELPHEGHHPDHGFSSYSPITDGKLVFAYFGSRGLYCYDKQGELKWKKRFGQMKVANSFGEGSSPSLSGNTLVVNWDHEGEDFIAAFDKETGNELWRQARDEQTSWATPLIVEHDGKTQVVTSATRKIRSYDLASGKQIWECGGMTANVIPSPVASGGVVYATSGFRGNALLAIRLGRTGDLTDTDAIAWKKSEGTPYVPSPLLYGDKLYFYSGNNAMLSCRDIKSGEASIDRQRIEGMQGVYASPVGAGGRVYLVGRNGVSLVIKHSEKLEVLATNRLDERFDASPAIAGKDLFLRGQENLYCIAEK